MVPSDNWSQFKLANDLLLSSLSSSATANTKNTSGIEKFKVLNITHMSAQRKDGHSSLYYLSPHEGPASTKRQDCSHWCLPGVPDTWNELLYALFLKNQAS